MFFVDIDGFEFEVTISGVYIHAKSRITETESHERLSIDLGREDRKCGVNDLLACSFRQAPCVLILEVTGGSYVCSFVRAMAKQNNVRFVTLVDQLWPMGYPLAWL